MVFARNAQIVWNSDEIPEIYYKLIKYADIFEYIDWRKVSPEIGTGAISLNKETTKNFKEHLQIAHCMNGNFLAGLVHHNTIHCYFCYKIFHSNSNLISGLVN